MHNGCLVEHTNHHVPGSEMVIYKIIHGHCHTTTIILDSPFAPPFPPMLYTITIQLNLLDDSYRVEHDCGNRGLREGILMRVLKDLS